jgi:hypothetical protein
VRPAGLLTSAALLAWVGLAAPARAEEPAAPVPSGNAQATTAAAPEEPAYDEDLDLDRAEPDFEVVTLPTNLRLPRHALAFRLTHRFARDLGEGDFSDLLADFFGFDGAPRSAWASASGSSAARSSGSTARATGRSSSVPSRSCSARGRPRSACRLRARSKA